MRSGSLRWSLRRRTGTMKVARTCTVGSGAGGSITLLGGGRGRAVQRWATGGGKSPKEVVRGSALNWGVGVFEGSDYLQG